MLDPQELTAASLGAGLAGWRMMLGTVKDTRTSGASSR